MKIVKKFQMKIVIFTAVKYRCILHGNVFVIIIIMSLFKEDNIFSASTNLTYGPHKTWLNTYYLQTVKIYIYKIVQDTLKFDFKIFSD